MRKRVPQEESIVRRNLADILKLATAGDMELAVPARLRPPHKLAGGKDAGLSRWGTGPRPSSSLRIGPSLPNSASMTCATQSTGYTATCRTVRWARSVLRWR